MSSNPHDKDHTLTHYGILGMRWGVRRGQKALDRAAGRTEDYNQAQAKKKTPMSQMTNAELQQFITRKNLEMQYKALKAKDISAGRKFAQDIVKQVGTELLKDAIKGGVNYAITGAVDGNVGKNAVSGIATGINNARQNAHYRKTGG